MTVTEAPVASGFQVDINEPRLWVDGVPHDVFARLRAESPVHYSPIGPRFESGQLLSGGPGYWTVTRYADVVEVMRDHERFSSAQGGGVADLPEENLQALQHAFITMDPPDHAKHRRVVQRAFVPRSVERMKETVVDTATRLVADFVARGGGDVVEDLSSELALTVLSEVLGIPSDDRHVLLEWSEKITDPETQQLEGLDGVVKAFSDMYVYAAQLLRDRRENPRDDLTTTFALAEVDGRPMREFDFGMMMLLLFQAGQVTVRNTIPLGLLTLLAHPAELARLRADRALMPTAIEEILRHTTIASMFRRTATIDTEIAGTPIEAGAKVVAVLASANMDEDVFPDPFRFDVGRTPNHHIAFGSGQHFCIGAHIARMEIRTMIELLLDHSLSLVGPVEYLGSPGLNGIRHLPISVG